MQAAITIQRAFRSYFRLKYRGISTTQLLEQKRKDDWRDSQILQSAFLLSDENVSGLSTELMFGKSEIERSSSIKAAWEMEKLEESKVQEDS